MSNKLRKKTMIEMLTDRENVASGYTDKPMPVVNTFEKVNNRINQNNVNSSNNSTWEKVQARVNNIISTNNNLTGIADNINKNKENNKKYDVTKNFTNTNPTEIKKDNKAKKIDIEEVKYNAEKENKEKRQEREMQEAKNTENIGTVALQRGSHLLEDILQKPKSMYNGYQFGDISKTVGSTIAGGVTHFVEGAKSVGDALANTGAYGVATGADIIGQKDFSKRLIKAIKANQKENQEAIDKVNNIFDKNSILGETSNQGLNSVGQSSAFGAIGTGGAKKVADVLTFSMGASSGFDEAYNQENTNNWEAILKATGGGMSSYFTENMFDWLGYGGNKLTKGLKEEIGQKFIKGIARGLTKLGFSATGEGVEEVAEEILNKKVVNNLVNKIIGENKYSTDIDIAETVSNAFIATLSVLGTGVGPTIVNGNYESQQIKQNTEIIQNSGLTDFQKEKLSEVSKKYNLNSEEIEKMINKTKNGKYEENPPMTINNEQVLNNNQQITQESNKIAQNQSSEQIENNIQNDVKIDYNNEENIEKSFSGYTENEINNLKSNKIRIANSEQDITNFANTATKLPGNIKMYVAKVKNNISNFIKNKFNIDLDEYNISLSTNSIRHVMKEHSNVTKEENRGQIAVTYDDFKYIPSIINNPDNITTSGKTKQEKPVLIFEKNINGNNVVVTYVSDKHKNLELQTMYKFKNNKKNSLVTATNEINSLDITPKANSDTAVDTVNNVSTTNNIIPQEEKNNKKFLTNENNYNTQENLQNYQNSAQKYNIDLNNDTVKAIFGTADRRGIKISYDDTMFTNSNQNAVWMLNEDGSREIIINPNADNQKTLQSILIHELTHDMEGTEEYKALSKTVLDKMKTQEGYQDAYNNLKDMYSKVYDINSDNFNSLVEQEAVADFLGENLGNQEFLNELVKSQPRNTVQKIYDWIVDKINKLTGYNTEKLYWQDVKTKFEKAFNSDFNNENQNSKFSINKELLDSNGKLKSFKEQLEDENFSKTSPYVVSEDSLGLVDNNYPITINPSTIDKINNKHDISKQELYDLPNKLKNYTLVTKSQNRNDSIIVFIDQFDNQNRPIMVSMELNKKIRAYNINNITSVYGRENGANFVEKLITNGKVLKQGKKIKQWLQSIGVQFSKEVNNALLNNIVPSSNSDVNTTKYSMQENENNTQNSYKYIPINEVDNNKNLVYNNNLDLSTVEEGDLINNFYKALTKKQWAKYHKKMNSIMGKTNGDLSRTDIIDGKLITTKIENHKEQVVDVIKISSNIPSITKDIVERANKYGYSREELLEAFGEVYGEKNVRRYDSANNKFSTLPTRESIKNNRRINENSRQINGKTTKGEIINFINNGRIENSNKSSFSLPQKEETDNKGRKLTKEQQEYFKDSKVRDENGNLKTVYHGSNSEFTIFDIGKGGKSNTNAGIGFWFTTDKNGATKFAENNWYGDKKQTTYEGYIDLKNPKVFETIENNPKLQEINDNLSKLKEEIYKLENKNIEIEINKERIRWATSEDELNFIAKTYGIEINDLKRYNKIINEYNGLEKQYDNEKYTDSYEQFRTEIYKLAGKDAQTANTGGTGMYIENHEDLVKQYREKLISEGYDGIIIKDTHYDNGVFETDKKVNTQYVIFNSNQFKNIDNANPTSNPDIRYSKENAGKWQEFLEKHSINKGTRNTIKEVKLPISEAKFQDVINNAKYIPNDEKANLLKDIENMPKTTLSLKEFKEFVESENNTYKKLDDEKLNTNLTYNSGRKEIYQKYLSSKNNYDTSSLENAKDIIKANPQGRRTKSQWLNIAKQIGTEIANKSNTEIEEIAYRTWQDERPSSKESLNRQDEKFVKFDSDEWINTIYNSVKEQRAKFSISNESSKNIENNSNLQYNKTERESDINYEKRYSSNAGRRVQKLLENYRRGQIVKENSNGIIQKIPTQEEIKKAIIDFANAYSKKDLNSKEKNMLNMYKKLNGNVIFYEYGKDNIDIGLTDKNTVYIDTLAEENVDNIAYHELVHFLRKNNNAEYLNNIKPIIDKIANDFDQQEIIYNYAMSSSENFEIGMLDGNHQEILAEEVIGDTIANIYGNLEVDYGLDLNDIQTIKNTIDRLLKKSSTQSSFSLPQNKKAQLPQTNTTIDEDLQAFRDETDKLGTIVPIEEEIANGNNKTNNQLPDTKSIIADKKTNPKTSYKDFVRELRKKFTNKGVAVDELFKSTGNKQGIYKYDRSLSAFNEAQVSIGKHQVNTNGEVVGDSLISIYDQAEELGIDKKSFDDYLLNKNNIARTKWEKSYYGESITSKDNEKIVSNYEQKYPQIKELGKKISDYNRNNLKILKGTFITEDLYNKLVEMYPDYVPAVKNIVETPGFQEYDNLGHQLLKKAIGGDGEIISPLESMAGQTVSYIKAFRRNEAIKEVYKSLKTNINELYDLGEIIDLDQAHMEIERAVGYDDVKKCYTATVFENGSAKTFKISKDIYDAFTPNKAITDFENTSIMKVLGGITSSASKEFKAVTTGYNPLYALKNMIRDLNDAPINSKYNVGKFLINWGKAYKQIITNGKYYQEYVNAGGGANTYFDYNEGVLPTKTKNPVKKIGKGFINRVEAINKIVETAPRLAEYMLTRKNGGSIDEALYNSAEVTTNFKRGGEITKVADKYAVPFLNASVQGLSKQFRNLTGQNGLKGYANLVINSAVAGILPSVLNHLLLDDDEDYEKLEDYLKDNYYLIKLDNNQQNFIRIPKGRVAGLLGATAVRIIRKIEGEEEAFNNYFSEVIWNNIGVNNPLTNNLFAPLIQASNNEAWFEGSIYSESKYKNMLPVEITDEKTDKLSNEVAKILHDIIPEKTYKKLSEESNLFKVIATPKLLNYVLDQYSGFAGDFVLPMLTPYAENNAIIDQFTTSSILKNKAVSEFYEMLGNNYQNSQFATDSDKLTYQYLFGVSKEVGELYGEKSKIQNNNKLSNEVKKEQTYRIQEQINKKMEEAVKEVKNMKISNNTASFNGTDYYKDEEDNWKKIDEEDKIENISLDTYYTYKNTIEKANKSKKESEDKSLTNNEKINILNQGTYTNKEKDAIYTSTTGKEDDTYMGLKILNNNSVDDIEEYLNFKTMTFESDKENDGTKDGKTISGSKSQKIKNYLNNTSFNEAIKAYLYASKSSNKLDEKQRKYFTDYINSLNITDEEKRKLYLDLGKNNIIEMADGSINWK